MTVHFVLFLVSVKRRGLPKVTTGCCVFFPCYRYFTLVQYRSNLFFFLYFWLPHLASYSTLKHHPSLSLVQTCKVLFMGECHLFQEVLLLLQVRSVRYKAHRFSHSKRWLWAICESQKSMWQIVYSRDELWRPRLLLCFPFVCFLRGKMTLFREVTA